MSRTLAHKRILLKISGESLKGKNEFGYCAESVRKVTALVAGAMKEGAQIALVVGAGNIWRGLAGSKGGMDRVTADQMGMLATAMNALCLKDAFLAAGIRCNIHSAVSMEPFAKRFDREEAIRQLERGELVIFACGTGYSYFTTDTTAALRALEIKADALLKATKVDGIYSDDPVKVQGATRYSVLSFAEVAQKRFGVMDASAFALCADNNLPIVVFNFSDPEALKAVISGDYSKGTIVK